MTSREEHAVPAWHRIESLSLLGLGGTVGAVGMMAIILLGAVIGSSTGSVALIYIFSSLGISFFLAILGIQGFQIYRAPRRVGFGLSSLLLEKRSGDSKEIPFVDIDSLWLSRYPTGWYLELRKRDGQRMALGPGLSETYGRSLLEKYAEWLLTNVGKTVGIRELRGMYPRIQLVLRTSQEHVGGA